MIESVNQHLEAGGKVALCCILFGNNNKETERLYFVNCRLPSMIVEGEIEKWKSYVKNNTTSRHMMVKDFMKFQNRVGEING